METKNYQKLQGLALVKNVELSDTLRESNEANEMLSVKLYIEYKDTVNETDTADLLGRMDKDLLAFVKPAATNNEYTYLLDCRRLGFNVGDDDKALEHVKKNLLNKEVVFTTFVFKVGVLLKGTQYDGVSAVSSDTREYSSLNVTYLLVNNDAEGAFESVKGQLVARLDDGRYFVGRNVKPADEKSKKPAVNVDEMKRKELTEFIKDNGLSIDPDDFEEIADLRKAVKEELA